MSSFKDGDYVILDTDGSYNFTSDELKLFAGILQVTVGNRYSFVVSPLNPDRILLSCYFKPCHVFTKDDYEFV